MSEDSVSVKRCGQANHRPWPRHWYDDSLDECDVQVDDFKDSGVEEQEEWYRANCDSRKPCRGVNANVCVAEGCYGEACLRQSGTDGSFGEPFGDLFDGLLGSRRRDATFVYWHNDLTVDMNLIVPRSELDTFLGQVEDAEFPGIFMALFEDD